MLNNNYISKTVELLLKIKPLLIVLIGLIDIFLSSYYTQSAYRFIIYIGLLAATGALVPLIKTIKFHTHKVLAYMYIGFASYWVVGNAFRESILIFGDFLPILIFAMANAIAILIAITDGSKKGYIYGSMGFIVAFYNVLITKDLSYVGGKADMLILVAILWALIPVLWCHSLSSTTSKLKFNPRKVFFSIIKTSIYTLPLYIILSIAVIISHTSGSYGIPRVSIREYITANPQIIEGIIPVFWFYFLAHITMIMIAFFSSELVIHTYNIKKEIKEDGEITYHLDRKVEAPEIETHDPYKKIIKEMKSFKKDFKASKIDRLAATQQMGKIRNEIEILTSKYEHGSKDIAEKALREIEKDIEFAFRQ